MESENDLVKSLKLSAKVEGTDQAKTRSPITTGIKKPSNSPYSQSLREHNMGIFTVLPYYTMKLLTQN